MSCENLSFFESLKCYLAYAIVDHTIQLFAIMIPLIAFLFLVYRYIDDKNHRNKEENAKIEEKRTTLINLLEEHYSFIGDEHMNFVSKANRHINCSNIYHDVISEINGYPRTTEAAENINTYGDESNPGLQTMEGIYRQIVKCYELTSIFLNNIKVKEYKNNASILNDERIIHDLMRDSKNWIDRGKWITKGL